MRRILLWFLTTVSTVVLLFGYRTSTSSALPDGAAGGTGAGTTTAPRSTTSSGSTTTGSATALPPTAQGQFTGSVADTRWGPVQTRITVVGGRITAVDVVEYPTQNPKDREINADAVPTLIDETVRAQGADIDMVSGATVTSTGYLESLQSALDQAHVVRTATRPPAVRHVEHVMGLPVSLALRGRHADDPSGRDAWRAVMASLRDADRVFSTYRPDSVVSRIDRGELALDDPRVPDEVGDVLDLADRAERASDGAFSAWRTDTGGRRRLDPSGVVKGWAVERAAAALRALDDTDFCLGAGGDVLGRVVDPDLPWRIGVEDPRDPHRVLATVPLRDGAVATSGTAHRGDHVVDARTGRPPVGVAAVTVVHRSLTWADIDATAAFAQGCDAAVWLRRRVGRTGLVVATDGTVTAVPDAGA